MMTVFHAVRAHNVVPGHIAQIDVIGKITKTKRNRKGRVVVYLDCGSKLVLDRNTTMMIGE